MATFSDVVDRESAWLSTVDSLPNLTGIFVNPQTNASTIFTRLPRTFDRKVNSLFVMRAPTESATLDRETNTRGIWTHRLMLIVWWPITKDALGDGSKDELACEQAVDAILGRITGVPPSASGPGDHTHGGRFLSAAEDWHHRVQVEWPDMVKAYADSVIELRIVFTVDDFDVPL